jgi:hypothetical protein
MIFRREWDYWDEIFKIQDKFADGNCRLFDILWQTRSWWALQRSQNGKRKLILLHFLKECDDGSLVHKKVYESNREFSIIICSTKPTPYWTFRIMIKPQDASPTLSKNFLLKKFSTILHWRVLKYERPGLFSTVFECLSSYMIIRCSTNRDIGTIFQQSFLATTKPD